MSFLQVSSWRSSTHQTHIWTDPISKPKRPKTHQENSRTSWISLKSLDYIIQDRTVHKDETSPWNPCEQLEALNPHSEWYQPQHRMRPRIDLKEMETKEVETILAERVRKIWRRVSENFWSNGKTSQKKKLASNAPKILTPPRPILKIST